MSRLHICCLCFSMARVIVAFTVFCACRASCLSLGFIYVLPVCLSCLSVFGTGSDGDLNTQKEARRTGREKRREDIVERRAAPTRKGLAGVCLCNERCAQPSSKWKGHSEKATEQRHTATQAPEKAVEAKIDILQVARSTQHGAHKISTVLRACPYIDVVQRHGARRTAAHPRTKDRREPWPRSRIGSRT